MAIQRSTGISRSTDQISSSAAVVDSSETGGRIASLVAWLVDGAGKEANCEERSGDVGQTFVSGPLELGAIARDQD